MSVILPATGRDPVRDTAAKEATLRVSTQPFVNKKKLALWSVIAAMTLSVTLYSEIPLLRQVRERAYLSTIPLLIGPHIAGGLFALLSGPLQFSSRIRRRYPRVHRITGRIYVISVLIAAPLAIALSTHRHDQRATYFVVATCCQAGTWAMATIAAFLTARNGHIAQHREWMIRSYALTFTFVGTRVLQPFSAWTRHSEAGFAIEIILITFYSILIPDLSLHWKQLTTPRAQIDTGGSHNAVRQKTQLRHQTSGSGEDHVSPGIHSGLA